VYILGMQAFTEVVARGEYVLPVLKT